MLYTKSLNSYAISIQTYAVLLILLITALTLLWLDGAHQSTSLKVADPPPYYLACYYSFNTTHLTPELINYNMCTHIIVAFAGIQTNNNMTLNISAENRQLLWRIVNMTSRTNTRVMISIGGKMIFGPMVKTHATRKMFLRSLMACIKEYKLDGVDLDWEWPVIDGGQKQKVQFIQLLYEIRTELDRHKKKYELSAAVGAPESIVNAAYYVQHIAEHVDFVNVMCYDYHFFMPMFPATDYNAPLFADPVDKGSIFEQLNSNYSIHLWLSLGMPVHKIVLGLPLYGHSYRLRSALNHGRHAPAEGFGLGNGGFVTYINVCQFIKSSKVATVVWDNASQVPYAYDYVNWISYDNPDSLREKVKFAKSMELKGVMVWSLNDDDYFGACGGKKYPLLNAINSELFDFS